MGVKSRAPRRGFRINNLLGAGEELAQGRGRSVGKASLCGDARMPGRADNIEEKRPAIELAVDRAFFADRRNDVVDHVLRDVIVPWLNDAGLDEGRHLNKWRLTDIDVPAAVLVLSLCDKTLDAKSLDRRDLVVQSREFGVH